VAVGADPPSPALAASFRHARRERLRSFVARNVDREQPNRPAPELDDPGSQGRGGQFADAPSQPAGSERCPSQGAHSGTLVIDTDDNRAAVVVRQAGRRVRNQRCRIVVHRTSRDLREIERIEDSKLDRLRADLDAARGSGQSTIVFTQFVDTLENVRDHLLPAYRSHLATFTGEGGSQFREGEGWISVSKRDLVEAVRAGRVSVVLATDAASEGLNLQACSYLINYDLPWNPMRVEQRIGRIDRIGQRFASVTVRNYVVPGTVEERVYAALAGRIDDFSELVGNLQPISALQRRPSDGSSRARARSARPPSRASSRSWTRR